MKRFKTFYLYLAGAIVAAVIFGYVIVFYHRSLDSLEIVLSAMPACILAYLAFKVHRESDDEELM